MKVVNWIKKLYNKLKNNDINYYCITYTIDGHFDAEHLWYVGGYDKTEANEYFLQSFDITRHDIISISLVYTEVLHPKIEANKDC